MIRPTIVAALAISLAACASEPPRRNGRHRGGPPPAGEAHMRRGLFISPSGEPFRGGDGLAAWFAGADADHDGAVTWAEFDADSERFFRRLDANGDGVIDGFEISAYEQTIAPEITALEGERPPGAQSGEAPRRGGGGMGGGGGRRGGGMGRHGGGMGRGGGAGGGAPDGGQPAGAGREGAARYSLIKEPEPVANADENVDGKVSRAEWAHATARRFAILDKQKTGRLTLDELQGERPKK
jgi:hypothetical protein